MTAALSDSAMNRNPPRLTHDRRVLLLALIAGAPAVIVAMILLWTGGHSPRLDWTLTVVIAGFWLGFCLRHARPRRLARCAPSPICWRRCARATIPSAPAPAPAATP